MASKIIGRVTCLIQCGHGAAHVKLKTDKAEGATAWPYVFCPACGHMAHTKNREQAAALARLTRPEKTDDSPVPVQIPTPTGISPPVVEPVAPPTPTPPKAAGGIFDMFKGASA
jgi:hypothetical protein